VLYRQCRDFIWGGLPFLTWMLTLAITSGADRVVLGWFVPAAEVGWYAAAFRIFGIPVFLPTLIMTPLFPALSRSVDSPEIIKRTISRTIRVVMLLMVPMTAGIIVVAPAVPSVLGWPADFDNAIPMMVILSLQLPIIAVDMVFGTVLLAIGRQGRWVTFGVLATVGKLVVDIAAIPIAEQMIGNGAVGASVVSLLAEFAMFGGAMWLTPKHLLDRHLVDHSVRVTVAGIATVLAGSALLPIGLAYAIVGGAVAYFGVAIALRAVTRDEIRILKEQMPGARRA
jgi:O-antigen/teichoic acid export membrane protein